ncbi:hypothetical protein BDY17DRAFT_170151 [Neohortaea acidophila]|uniref:Uncharacterized protein n=1 Tax=Neohortaea acidophila TaxID=245834 RepID=A0A6A6PNN5_9PEZI|nr:uncharacterized protein BDY17DRAFT_170151 [Neohortaea acidophila]KAF2481730.1 hypothetical protein BDY17DRAFT_170151 [Neohortaea acidophila]
MEGEEDPATQTSTTTGEGQHHHHHPTQGHITVPSHDDDDASRGAGTGLENVERGRDTSGSTSFPATTTSYSHDDSFTTRDGYAGVPAGVGVGGGSGRFGDDDSFVEPLPFRRAMSGGRCCADCFFGSDERGREGRKGDSTLGKLVEKTGSAVGSAMLVEKGREKREQKGAGEGEDGGHAN